MQFQHYEIYFEIVFCVGLSVKHQIVSAWRNFFMYSPVFWLLLPLSLNSIKASLSINLSVLVCKTESKMWPNSMILTGKKLST